MGRMNATTRKNIPLATGCIDYFPDALTAVAALSHRGNEQHNPGEPLHWSRDKSNDHADCLMRHFKERYETDDDGFLHLVKVAWRALADLQEYIERAGYNSAVPEPYQDGETIGEYYGMTPDVEYSSWTPVQGQPKDVVYSEPRVEDGRIRIDSTLER